MMMRCLFLAAALAACRAAAAPKEIWLTPERRAQLKAIVSRPYVTKREDLGDGTERLQWRNGAREWATTQAVRRVAGAKARNPHDDAKREAAAALASKDRLRRAVLDLAANAKITGKELRTLAAEHAD